MILGAIMRREKQLSPMVNDFNRQRFLNDVAWKLEFIHLRLRTK